MGLLYLYLYLYLYLLPVVGNTAASTRSILLRANI